MEIDHSDQTVQQDGYNILGQDLDRSQGVRLRSNSVRSEEKNAAVHAEIERVNRLPSNSSYALHRLRVLNKILNLISVQLKDVMKYIEVSRRVRWKHSCEMVVVGITRLPRLYFSNMLYRRK